MNFLVQNEDMQVTPEHETTSGGSAISKAMCISKDKPLKNCSRLGAHKSQKQFPGAPLEIRVTVPCSLQENTSSVPAVTEVMSQSKVEPSESLGINEAQEQVFSTVGPRISETYSLQAEPIANSEATVSSARKSFKQLSAEGFFRCGNRNGSCGYLTLLPTQFEVHMKEEHANECAFPCVHCGRVEMTCDSLLQHLEEHLTQQRLLLYCAESTCNFNSSSPDDVLQHIVNSHSTLTSFTCWCCSASFFSIHTFVTHVQQNMLQVAKCPHCSAKDSDRQRILTHISSSHPGYGRMVRIHKLFLCENRTMSDWHDQNVELQDFSEHNSTASYSTRPIPRVHNRTIKQETDCIDLTGSADCEDEITVDIDDREKERGETSQDKVSERRDSSCRQSTDVIADITATSGDWNEHEGNKERGTTVQTINRKYKTRESGSNARQKTHRAQDPSVSSNKKQIPSGDLNEHEGNKERGTTVQTIKRQYKTRESGSNDRQKNHRAQGPSVSSNKKQIPSDSKIVTKDCFTEIVTGGKTTYRCNFCDYNFDKGCKNKNSIRNRQSQHINTKHKGKRAAGMSS